MKPQNAGETPNPRLSLPKDSQLPPRRAILSVKTSRAAKPKLHFLLTRERQERRSGVSSASAAHPRQQLQVTPGLSRGGWDGSEHKKRRNSSPLALPVSGSRSG